jgi:hypothetical protein
MRLAKTNYIKKYFLNLNKDAEIGKKEVGYVRIK